MKYRLLLFALLCGASAMATVEVGPLQSQNNLSDVANPATALANLGGMSNPMDSAGDMIYGGASGVVTKLDSGTSGQFLASGGAATPVWTTLLPLANGGTAKAITAVNGGLCYSDADSLEITSAGTAQQWVLSGGAGAPTMSNTTTTGKTIDGSADETQLTVQGNGTQSGPTVLVESSTGVDWFKVTGTNVQMRRLLVRGSTGESNPIIFLHEDEDIGSNNISIQTPANLTANWVWTLPDNDGSANQVMQTDGSGATSWVGPARSSSTSSTSATCTTSCAGSALLTGGGCESSGASLLIESYPSSTTAWSCTYADALSNCTAYAICL